MPDLNRLTVSQISQILDKATTELLCDLILYDFKFYFEQVARPGYLFTEKHDQAFDFFNSGSHNLLLGFPGSGKSECLHAARHAWMANRNRWEVLNGLADRPMLFGSGSYNVKMATVFTRDIKRQLALPVMAFCFGTMIDPQSSDAGFNLLGLDYSHEKDNAVQAYGLAEGDVAGAHCDVLTADDLVTFRLARSPVEREALRQKVPMDIKRVLRRLPHKFNGIERQPQFNVLGYPHFADDIYATFQDESQYPSLAGRLTRFPALTDEGQSYFPEIYPTDLVLEWKRETPEIIWRSVYQCQSKAMEGDIVRAKWLVFEDKYPVPDEVDVYIGGDLSIGETSDAARTAYFALYYDPNTQCRWEGDCVYGHWTFAERIQHLKDFAAAYKNNPKRRLKKILLEKPASGSDVVRILQDTTDLPIDALTPTKDKNLNLIETQHLWENKKMILRGPERTDYIPRIGTWVDELLTRRTGVAPANGTVDRTDAFLIANKGIGGMDGYIEFLRRRAEAVKQQKEQKEKV